MNDLMTVSNIEGINNDLLQMITFKNEGVTKWAIRNKFGKFTPLFENTPYIDVLDNNSLLLIGEINGNRKIYNVHDVDIKEDGFYTAAITLGKFLYLHNVNQNTAVVTTDRGEYLIDKRTLKQKSDIFNAISFLDNRLDYLKIVNHDGRDYYFYGELYVNGEIGRKIFDDDDVEDIYYNVPILETDNSYDEIDEDGLEELLTQSLRKKKSLKKEKIKIMHRLNDVSRTYIDRF